MDHLEYSSRNVFVPAEVDRPGKMRSDPQWLEAKLESAKARFVPVWQDLNLFPGRESWQPVVLQRPELGGFITKADSLTLLGSDGEYYFWVLDLPESDADISSQFVKRGEFQDLKKGGFSGPLTQRVVDERQGYGLLAPQCLLLRKMRPPHPCFERKACPNLNQ